MMINAEHLVGKTLGRYKIVSYLGYGAMASVYKAHQPSLDRYVAIKILHPHFANDLEFLTQFKQEARNLATLRYPNIVQVYDFDIYKGIPHIVMEYIDGPTLRDVVEETRRRLVRVSLAKSVRIVQNIGLALSYAHKRQMIHRDVKPGNVILEKTGRVVLGDFGLAKYITSQKRVTEPGVVKGTPAYMSPEQGMGKSGGCPSDIYSLGVIFYELSTGKLPFDADNPMAIAMKHVKEPVPPPKSIVPELPDKVQEIILRAMDKDPNRRFPSVDHMLRDIHSITRQIKTTKLPTAKLSLDDTAYTPIPQTAEDAQASLHFVDTGQILNLEGDAEYTIGRRYKQQAIIPDIDLTPFKAYEWGISRLHARINVGDRSVFVTDLGSSNGTWIEGKRMTANQPCEVKHGQVFFLGKLRIQVLVYE